MEQHPVPQNVTTFQFRLIGDMTIKQFGYLAIGAIAAYICYKLPLPFFFTWPLTIASALLGFGLAFVPIEERPMDIWILSFFKSIYSPTQYIWHKAPTAPTPVAQPTAVKPATVQPVPQVVPQAIAVAMPTVPAARRSPVSLFGFLSGFLDSLRMPQRPVPAAPVAASTAPTPPGPSAVAGGIATAETIGHSLTDSIGRIFAPVPSMPSVRHTVKPPPAPPPAGGHIPKTAPPTVVPHVYVRQPMDPFGWVRDMFQTKPKPVGKDTSLPDIFSKAPTGSITGKRLDLSTPPTVTQPSPQVAEAVSAAQKKTAALEEKLGTLQTELKSKTLTEDRILELQKQLTEALGQREGLEKELLSLRQKIDSSVGQSAPVTPVMSETPTVTATPQPTVKVISPDAAMKAGLPRLTTFPNVVTGIIKDNTNTLLPGVLVTVRDKEGVPLRALKTNKLGQFAASTPLPNGTYLVEIEDPRGRFSFDRAQITVNGNVMPALEILAKSQKELSREKLAKEIFGSQM